MVRHTSKILKHLLQDFLSLSNQFGTLCIKRITTYVDCKLLKTHTYFFLLELEPCKCSKQENLLVTEPVFSGQFCGALIFLSIQA